MADKNKELQNQKTRKFPVILLITAAIITGAAGASGGISAVILSLSYVFFTMSFFLILIAVFHGSKIQRLKREYKKNVKKDDVPDASVPIIKFFNNALARITSFYLDENPSDKNTSDKNNSTDGTLTETAEPANRLQVSGLIEIQKDAPAKLSRNGAKSAQIRLEVLYVISFVVLAIWRLSQMFEIVPLPFTGFNFSVVDAVLLLVFPCVAVTYIKMRKNEGAYPGDKTSRELLYVLSCVSLVYAAVIAATLVLNIDILVLLQWVFYAAMVYLIAALAGNILLSGLKNKIFGDFNYTLIPKISKAAQSEDFLDSEEIRVNFSLKSLYTIRYSLKILPGLILALVFVLFFSTSIFVVQPHQKAAVYRFGKLTPSSIVGEGLHFKLPWPIDIAEIHDVHRINSMQVGYESSYNINFLWTQLHDGGEYLLLLGNGNEKVSVNMSLVFNISDLYVYLKNNTSPEAILSAAAYEALMNRTVNTTLDTFLSIDRSSLSASIQEELAEFSANAGLGLSVIQVIIEGIHPPAEVADVYQMVVSAAIDRNTMITNAQTEAQRRLIDADRESRSIVNYAQARQYYRISSAQQEMAVFFAAMEAHAINPRSFELTRWLNTHERVIAGSKVHVFSPGTEGGIHRSVLRQSSAISQFNTPQLLEELYE